MYSFIKLNLNQKINLKFNLNKGEGKRMVVVYVTRHAHKKYFERSDEGTIFIEDGLKYGTLMLKKKNHIILFCPPFYFVLTFERGKWYLITVTRAQPFELLYAKQVMPRESPFAGEEVKLKFI